VGVDSDQKKRREWTVDGDKRKMCAESVWDMKVANEPGV
jgi:hypothetical protein